MTPVKEVKLERVLIEMFVESIDHPSRTVAALVAPGRWSVAVYAKTSLLKILDPLKLGRYVAVGRLLYPLLTKKPKSICLQYKVSPFLFFSKG